MNLDKVAADQFYKNNGDKIKQNWFLYEYANILFSKIEDSPELAAYRKKPDGQQYDIKVAFLKFIS